MTAKHTAKTPIRRKQRLAESEQVRKYALSRQTRVTPILVKGVGKPTLATLTPSQMAEVRVDDERYQRIRNVDEVNALIHTLREGGLILDPVTISRRPDGSLWVVDGQQRFWAHLETETPMLALIYDVPDVDTEKMAFIVMNTLKVVNAAVRVHAWPGPAATYLRAQNDDPHSLLFCQIDMGKNHNRVFTATPLLKALLIVMAGLGTGTMPVNSTLRRSDVAWNANVAARDRARAFANLAAMVFGRQEGSGKTRATQSALFALASVAYDYWQHAVRVPDERTIGLLRRINWDTLVPSNALRFVPVIKAAIEARWKP